MQASTRVMTRKWKGFNAATSSASICSVTRIDPISAPIPAPRRPASTSEVITGPISFTTDKANMLGSTASAPNRTRVPRLCMASTTPMASPVMEVSRKLLDPTSSICRSNSRPSNGRRQTRRKNRPMNRLSPPMSSRSWVMGDGFIPAQTCLQLGAKVWTRLPASHPGRAGQIDTGFPVCGVSVRAARSRLLP